MFGDKWHRCGVCSFMRQSIDEVLQHLEEAHGYLRADAAASIIIVDPNRFCVSIEVIDNSTGDNVVNEGFNCSHASVVVEALEKVIQTMKALEVA